MDPITIRYLKLINNAPGAIACPAAQAANHETPSVVWSGLTDPDFKYWTSPDEQIVVDLGNEAISPGVPFHLSSGTTLGVEYTDDRQQFVFNHDSDVMATCQLVGSDEARTLKYVGSESSKPQGKIEGINTVSTVMNVGAILRSILQNTEDVLGPWTGEVHWDAAAGFGLVTKALLGISAYLVAQGYGVTPSRKGNTAKFSIKLIDVVPAMPLSVKVDWNAAILIVAKEIPEIKLENKGITEARL